MHETASSPSSSWRVFQRVFRSAGERLLWRHTTLEPLFETFTRSTTAPREASGERRDTPRLHEEVVLAGEARPAVSCRVGAEAVCRVHVPPGAVFVVHGGLTSDIACRVRFEVSVDGVAQSRELIAGAPWVPLRVSFASVARWNPVEVVLRTVPLEGPVEHAVSYWGSPELRWRRDVGELRAAVTRAIKYYGVVGLVGRLWAHGSALKTDPQAAYRVWLETHTPRTAELDRMRAAGAAIVPHPRFALLVIGGDPSGLRRTFASIERQVYDDWETWQWSPERQPGFDAAARPATRVIDGRTRSESEARNLVAESSASDFVVVLDAGDELAPHALFTFAKYAAEHPAADIIYSDEDRLTPAGPAAPAFKPDWSPEYLLSRMYLGKVLAARRRAVRSAGGYRTGLDGAHDFDIALRLATAGAVVGHVADVLCHRGEVHPSSGESRVAEQRALVDIWGDQATVTAGAVDGLWRVQPVYSDTPRVSIVIPTDARTGSTFAGRQPLVAQCLRSILERTDYPHYDLLIVDNGEFPREAAVLLAGVPHMRVSYSWTGAFNFSRKINFAVARATNDYVLLLNDDVQVINREWLTAMLDYARQPAIGAVGAKLFYPDGRLQHVGVATGVCGIAAHLLHQHPGGSAGCGQIALAARNCSAVTGACLLTRRAVYQEVGGFDDRLAVDFNDVDFCLRVRRAGYRIVFTPYAKLYHHESASFGPRVPSHQDAEQMRRIWGSSLDEDPYYNRNLSREFPDCRVRAVDHGQPARIVRE